MQSKAEQTSALLAVRVDDQSCNEQANGNSNRDLDHTKAKACNGCISGGVCGSTVPRSNEIISHRIGVFKTSYQRPTRRETRRHEYKDAGKNGGGSVSMPQPTVQIAEYSDCEGAHGVRNFRARPELGGTPIVGDIA